MKTETGSEEERELLEIEDLYLSFGGVNALLGLSLRVADGEIHSLIGPNGAGKSSLCNLLSGLVQPQRGQVLFQGEEILGLGADAIARRGLARSFQSAGLFQSLSVVENLLLGRHLHMRAGFFSGALYYGWARREERRHLVVVEELLEALKIADLRHQPLGGLAYGAQRKVELGRALAMEPRLLLLDEPLAGLSPEESHELAGLVVEIKKRKKITVFLVEHDMSVIMEISDRVSVLNFGELLVTGSPSLVQSDRRVIEAYLGPEETHVFRPAAN